MHGASDWTEDKIKQAIKLGISAFNIDTDIRLAFCGTVCKETSKEHCDISDPRKILKNAREDVKRVVEKKMKMFGLAR